MNWAVDEGFTAVKFDPLVHGYEDFSMSRLVELGLFDGGRSTGGRRQTRSI